MKKLLLKVNTTAGSFTDWNDAQYTGVEVVHGDSVLLACQFTEALASTLSALDLTGALALRATIKTARTSDATLLAFQDSYNQGLFVSYEDLASGYVTWLLALSDAAVGTALGTSDSVSAWLEFSVLDSNNYPQTLIQIPITIYQQVDDGAVGTPSPTSPTYLTATEIAATYNQKYIGKTTAPTVTDDSDSDYAVGGVWIDETNDAAYVCIDNTVGAAIWLHVQAYDAALASIAGLTTTADQMLYTTGADTYAVTTITAAGRAILDDADAAAQRTTLGVVIGSDVQAYDADLDALAAQSGTGIVTRTAASTYAQRTITGMANEIDIADGDGVAGNPTVSLSDALTLTGKTITGGAFSDGTIDNAAIGATTPAAGSFTTLKMTTGAAANNTLISDADGNLSYVKNNLTATTSPSVTDDSAAGYAALSIWINTSTTEAYRCLDASVGAAVWEVATLTIDDLGTMAVQNSDTVAITGGSITGITDLAVADGGTGASSVLGAQTSLQVGDSIDFGMHGFTDRSETSIGFDDTTYTFTLTDTGAGWSYYRSGVKYTISGNKTVVLPGTPPATNKYYIYIDATDGTLTAGTTVWTLVDGKVSVAVVVWDDTLTPKYVLSDERHDCTFNQSEHVYQHTTYGTRLQTRGALADYTVAPASPTDANNTYSMAETKIRDEDIPHTLSALAAGGTYHIRYRTGAGTWVWLEQAIPFRYGTYIQYDNAGTMTDAGNNKFVNTYIVATNITGTARFVILHGQQEHSTLTAARDETFSDLTLDGLELSEATALYQIIWETSASYTTTGKCRIATAPVPIQGNLVQASSAPGLGTMSTQNADDVEITGGTIDGTIIGANSAAAGTFANLTATGSISFSGATISNLGTVTTADINGGTIDGATIATSDITVGAGKTLDVSAGTLTLANDQISGDKINGGTIGSVTIGQLAGAMDANSQAITNVNIDSGAIDGTTIGANSAAAGTFTTLTASSVSTTGDISQDAGTYHYLAGDASTDGSVRQYYDSTDDAIYIEKRESGSWVTKHTFTM